MRAAAALLIVAACATEPAETCPGPLVELRDPEVLVCTPRRAPSPECPLITLPPWPLCADLCDRIRDAATCAATDGCRIGWLDCLTFPDQCDHPQGFIGCYGVATLPPPEGACRDLAGPEACAARDDCAGIYVKGPNCPGGPGLPQPNGEACRFTYAACTDELSPPT